MLENHFLVAIVFAADHNYPKRREVCPLDLPAPRLSPIKQHQR